MTLIFGDKQTILDDRREVTHAEADELLEAALDKYKSIGLDMKTIAVNIMFVFNGWTDGILDTFDFEEGIKIGMTDIWNIKEASQAEETK